MDKQQIKVVAAVVQDGDKILCMQRCRDEQLSYISEHWEFPGGKVRTGESNHEALLREIKEELDWDIFVGKSIATVTYNYPDFDIELTAYWCRKGEGEFKLLNHLDFKWLSGIELEKLNWTAADRLLLPYII